MNDDKFRSAIIRLIEDQQAIQMVNRPSSAAWVAASAEIHRLANILTDGKTKDACGK